MSTEAEAASPEATLPKEGDVIAGKFLIQRVLGRGGMGVVVAAENVTLRQRVAVKFLLPEAVARVGSIERFLREARSAAMIQSEHVARVFDVGTLDTGSPYMVMELLSGSDLGELLAKEGKLAIATAVDYVLQACEAIAEAHAHGIIHRDLKPANLFLTARTDGSSLVKVLDFGLSKRPKTDSLDASLTQANAIMGSPFYMSPEQIRSLKALDSRSDVWSLGVILYQLIAGVRPFEAESLGALFLMIGADEPVPLKQVRPEVPDALDAAVMRCLQKDPVARTQSVSELARELAPFGSSDCSISVERIVRLLPVSAPPARGSITSEGESVTGSGPSPVKPGSMPPPPAPAEAAARSGSMQAVTSSLSGSKGSSPPAPGPPAATSEPRKSRAPLLALAAVAVLGLGGGAYALRPQQRGVPVAAATADRAATAAPPPAETAPAPVVTPTATEAPAASASATPSASASAAPTAAPSASAAAPAPAGKAGKTKAPVVKKKDPLERWR